MMRITKEAKKILAEFLNRVAQILFAMVIVGPFITGNLRIESTFVGVAGIIISLLLSILIALTIKEDD